MELYKWHKGTELPDAECDCVVLYQVTPALAERFHVSLTKMQTVGKSVFDPFARTCVLVDNDGDFIPQNWIIAYMPIEFPKEGAE